MLGFLRTTLDEFWGIMLDSGVWLVAGLALAGLVHAFVPAGFLARHLARREGKSTFGPIFKASLLGIPLPLCSCSVIPVAAGLRSSGAGKGASAAFAISTPQTGEESVPLTWALFGPVFALARPVIAVATALSAGLLIEQLTGDRSPRSHSTDDQNPTKSANACCSATKETPAIAGGSCCSSEYAPPSSRPSDQPLATPAPPKAETKSCCGSPAPEPDPDPAPRSCCSTEPATTADADPETKPTLAERTKKALRHSFVTMLLDLAPWLAVGLVLSAIIAAAVPEGWIAEHVGTGLVPMLLMLVVGLPLYVCATSSTPLAFSLVAAGLSPGAALVLLLAGPATNAATMSWALKDLGARALAIYLVVIAAFAVGAGLLFDATLSGFVRLADTAHAHDHAAVSVLQSGGAILFTAMLAVALVVRTKRFAASRAARTSPRARPATDRSAFDPQHDRVPSPEA